jgi:hypothetical protein
VDSGENQDYERPARPTAEKVARRAIILSVVSCRAITNKQLDNHEAASLATRANDWLQAIGLNEEVADSERRILTTPFGSLSERDAINGSWLSEAVLVLAWSLGRTELPPFYLQCDPAGAESSLGFLQSINETVLNNPSLRSSDELDEYNDFIYNLHWRLRDYSLRKRPYDCSNLLGDYAGKYGLELKDQDVCIAGVPITLADDTILRPVESITRERHRASNWLVGYDSEDFYEVGSDT